ncbi:MAG: phasin family protein [Pseudomonadota bacterium]
MSTLPEQFSAARKSHIEAQMSYFHQFTVKAVENAQKVMHLNIDTARASLEQSTQAMSQLLLVKDPRDLLALTTQSQQNFDSLMRYSRALLGIATGAQLEPIKQAAPAPEVPAQPELFAPADNIVAAPQPVAEEAPLPVAAKPIVKAVKKVVPKPVAAKPAAAPVPAAAKNKVVVSGIKPVEAAPPPAPVSGKPEVDAKASESKPRKKK